jgi:hypothetical protein
LQKEAVKSPAGPVLEKGETSLDKNKTFSVISLLRLALIYRMSDHGDGGVNE